MRIENLLLVFSFCFVSVAEATPIEVKEKFRFEAPEGWVTASNQTMGDLPTPVLEAVRARGETVTDYSAYTAKLDEQKRAVGWINVVNVPGGSVELSPKTLETFATAIGPAHAKKGMGATVINAGLGNIAGYDCILLNISISEKLDGPVTHQRKQVWFPVQNGSLVVTCEAPLSSFDSEYAPEFDKSLASFQIDNYNGGRIPTWLIRLFLVLLVVCGIGYFVKRSGILINKNPDKTPKNVKRLFK